MRGKNKIRVNSIVVVRVGLGHGNKSGTITKVLSKPGRKTDQRTFKFKSKNNFSLYEGHLTPFVLCENINYRHRYNTLNNVPVCYERVTDLRLATEEEKELRLKLKHH